MANESTCYLCSGPIERDQATVTIPRLALRLHLSCYERDLAAKASPDAGGARRSLAQALGARRSTRRAG